MDISQPMTKNSKAVVSQPGAWTWLQPHRALNREEVRFLLRRVLLPLPGGNSESENIYGYWIQIHAPLKQVLLLSVWEAKCPPGIGPGLLQPQRTALTTRRKDLAWEPSNLQSDLSGLSAQAPATCVGR